MALITLLSLQFMVFDTTFPSEIQILLQSVEDHE